MWMVSKSWVLVEQFKHSSQNLLLMQMVSHPGSIFLLLQMVSHSGSQHQKYERATYFLVRSANLQCNKTWCHETIVMAPEIWEERMGFQLLFILQFGAMTILVMASELWEGRMVFWLHWCLYFSLCLGLVPQDNGHGTRNMRGNPLQVYINGYVCSPVFYWTGPCWIYIYSVLCTLIVLCFIMFLLSWDRSLGRCF